MQGILKEDYQKALKKLSLFFPSNPVPFNGQIYQKQTGSRTSHQSLFRPLSRFRKIPLIIILSDQKSKKFDYLENQKSFLEELKNIFHSF